MPWWHVCGPATAAAALLGPSAKPVTPPTKHAPKHPTLDRRRATGTNYVETLRVQLHANCRVRRIYFADRLYSEEELPPEFKVRRGQ